MKIIKCYEDAIQYIGKEVESSNIPLWGVFNMTVEEFLAQFKEQRKGILLDVSLSYLKGLSFFVKDDIDEYWWDNLIVYEKGELE